MTTEIKSGQTWADKNGDRLRVELVRPAHVEFKWEVGIMAILTTAEFLSAYDLVEDATPTPLDPSKVKAGDAVTLEASGGRRVVAPVSERTLPGYTTGTWFLDVYADDDRPQSFSAVHWTLTAHQPAPEPEPEWKDGQIGDALVHGASVRGFISNDGESFVFAVPGGGYHEAGHGSFEDFVPLVVIDPAAVDLAHLRKVYLESKSWVTGIDAVLAELGIEATS